MERYVEERRRRRGGASLLAETDASHAAAPVGTDIAPLDKRRRRTPQGPTFSEAADLFVVEYGVMTQGERNAIYVAQKSDHLRVHLTPFFGDKPLAAITAGLI